MASDAYATSGALPFSEGPAGPPASRASIQRSLEQLRQHFHRHLDVIEAMARERALRGPGELRAREEQLQRRADELEQAELRMQAEAAQWEQERQAAIAQIDHDRRLLAEAWERVEREQVNAAVVPATERTRPASIARQPAAWPVPLAGETGRDQPVAEEILRQFQSLRRDVRRAAAAGCPS